MDEYNWEKYPAEDFGFCKEQSQPYYVSDDIPQSGNSRQSPTIVQYTEYH